MVCPKRTILLKSSDDPQCGSVLADVAMPVFVRATFPQVTVRRSLGYRRQGGYTDATDPPSTR